MSRRFVICSLCARSTSKGTTQVCRGVVFHFHSACWRERREECSELMDEASRVRSAPVPENAKVVSA